MKTTDEPFLLSPALKNYIWGGRRLYEEYGKKNEEKISESWECSVHPDGESYIVSGQEKGLSLREFLNACPSALGERVLKKYGTLPILVKLIDAEEDLSIQVHPSDEYARKNENGQLGKTEMWYILSSKPDASIIYGFHHRISKEKLKKSALDGTIEKYLNRLPVSKNDMFFIEPGTVHAIGKGILLCEIQENSNLTYRLYDYGRIDKSGKKRDLHIDKALDTVSLKGSLSPRQPIRLLKYRPGFMSELLKTCEYFSAERGIINTESLRELVRINESPYTFQVFLCFEGCFMLRMENTELLVFKGDTVFIPAGQRTFSLMGRASFLRIYC